MSDVHARVANAAAAEPLRIGVIGGGAAAEAIHLPALARVRGIETVAVVDPVAERIEHLKRTFGVPRSFADYRDAIPHIDAAILGIPHQYHAPVTIDLLRAGIDVLVEKPMALTTAECDAMIDASQRSGALLAVGLLRRFAPTLRWTKDALEGGLLGRVLSFSVREGVVFRWPVKSPAMFHPSCGGVTADLGSHVLDLLLWWFGDCTTVRYWDDAQGGVEADAVIELTMANGVTGRVELSRSRDLPNRCTIRGERATLEVGTKTDSTIALTPAAGQATLTGRAIVAGQPPPANLSDLFMAQMIDFVGAVRTRTAPAVSAEQARRSVALLEACYRQRQPLVFPFEPILVHRERAAKAS
jgi:predicted dehydrogenase